MTLRDRTPFDGKLVAFCGLDGSGKTTQLDLVAQDLREHFPVSVVRPVTRAYRDDPTVTAYLDGLLPPEEMRDAAIEMIMFAATDGFRQMRTVILPQLQAGAVVLCDRYVYSVYARAIARGLDDLYWLGQLYRYLPEPDLTLYFDVRPEEALRRIRARGGTPRWEELDMDRMGTVRSVFLDQPWGRRDNYRIIDGERPPGQIAAEIRPMVAAAVGTPAAAG